MTGDMQQHYKDLGYRIASDGVVEFYYVAFRTNIKTVTQEICLTGGFAWSNHLHDPARTIQFLPEKDKTYRYSRLGPFPNRTAAESKAIDSAMKIYNDPTRYGIWGTGGLHDIDATDYRNPNFR